MKMFLLDAISINISTGLHELIIIDDNGEKGWNKNTVKTEQ